MPRGATTKAKERTLQAHLKLNTKLVRYLMGLASMILDFRLENRL
jgi:hypothetical protein